MNLISVITPVYGASVNTLPDACESLRSQELPYGWTWEWLVQEDGETGDVARRLPDDPHISAGRGRHGGPGVARTLALARSRGSLIKVLDADDQLTDGALERDITVLTTHQDVSWTTSRAADLAVDGSTVSYPNDPAEGRLIGAEVLDHWLAHDYQLPVHPATLCVRRALVIALGGWMALPASEDTGLLLAASSVGTGYFIAETGLLYRKWSGQVTSQASHVEPAERHARMAIIKERALALAQYGALGSALNGAGPATMVAEPAAG